ncbi:MAG: hypothetical protein ACRC5M_04950 [Anaeroplasmataceae bacterium]
MKRNKRAAKNKRKKAKKERIDYQEKESLNTHACICLHKFIDLINYIDVTCGASSRYHYINILQDKVENDKRIIELIYEDPTYRFQTLEDIESPYYKVFISLLNSNVFKLKYYYTSHYPIEKIEVDRNRFTIHFEKMNIFKKIMFHIERYFYNR